MAEFEPQLIKAGATQLPPGIYMTRAVEGVTGAILFSVDVVEYTHGTVQNWQFRNGGGSFELFLGITLKDRLAADIWRVSPVAFGNVGIDLEQFVTAGNQYFIPFTGYYSFNKGIGGVETSSWTRIPADEVTAPALSAKVHVHVTL